MTAERKPGQGLIIIFTGNGKGKTTAALGLALRAVGREKRICLIQFIKGSWTYGELLSASRLAPEFELIVAGQGFVGIIDDDKPFEVHRMAAEHALSLATERIRSAAHDIVILDEINYAIRGKLIDVEPVKELLRSKPSKMHVVLTGRNAHPDLIEMADLVTEMKEIKHPYQKGILAQQGIDF